MQLGFNMRLSLEDGSNNESLSTEIAMTHLGPNSLHPQKYSLMD